MTRYSIQKVEGHTVKRDRVRKKEGYRVTRDTENRGSHSEEG